MKKTKHKSRLQRLEKLQAKSPAMDKEIKKEARRLKRELLRRVVNNEDTSNINDRGVDVIGRLLREAMAKR